MWSQDESASELNWEEALTWVQQKNRENYLGHSDWRLPNIKELQSIVDYSRSPETTGSAAIDPIFYTTLIVNEAGQIDYPFYWSSTTQADWTLSDQYVGIKIPVKVAYDSDIPCVMQALLECAQEHTQVAEHPEPHALFIGFGESSINIELRGWISEVDGMDQIRSELYQEIDQKFRSSNIQVPFPQQDLYVQMAQELVPATGC